MKRLLKFFIWSSLVVGLFAMSIVAVLWYLWSSNLPYIGSLREYNPPIITEVFSDDGEVIGRFWEEKRIVVSLDQVSEHLIHAFIAAEDARFFKHEGVDLLSIARALTKNLMAGKIEQGGSTITQQVTRSLLLKNPRKTYRRKAREALLSLQIEKNFSKERILFLYLNQIYLGHGAYGVEAAARTYFNKQAIELNLAESALLAGLPQAPSRYSPILHFNRAKARQKYVLERMREEGYITEIQEDEALSADLETKETDESSFERSPYFTEHIRRYLEKKYGRDLLYKGGLKVHTTLNLEKQRAAQTALRKGVMELDKREGYRGPLRHLSPKQMDNFREETAKKFIQDSPGLDSVVEGLVEKVDDQKGEVVISYGGKRGYLPLSEMEWARAPDPEVPYYAASVKLPSKVLKAGDVVFVRIKGKGTPPYDWKLSLEQEAVIQGALLSMEAESGRVRAMVGGRDFAVSQFNRAIQARRQPGSAFKPIIYAAALDRGMSPATVIIDAPYISKANPDEEIWRPKNYKEKFFGPTLFRTALIKSRNVITVKILKKIGVYHAIQYAERLGIQSDLSPDLSLALGSSGVSLYEITRAYLVFANGGMLVEPIFINRILDRSGQIIEENQPSMHETIPEETAHVMTDLLKAVIREGTGWRVKALKRPAAGKTGTTNDLRDAWFIGFTPGLVTGVWVGYDDRRPMGKGETGSRAASPIWLYFMSEILKDSPVEDFSVPEGVVFAKIDAKTGLLASPYSENTVFQAFKEGTEPKEYSPRPQAAKSGQFSQFDMDYPQ
ncbi:MAG: PBP1A family penicillin-binding protein [Deltaproteobacteria bacterium]|nr:MAG: PBP1A family penicillin-binding protein [Deltaproteobacteria bacterium]